MTCREQLPRRRAFRPCLAREQGLAGTTRHPVGVGFQTPSRSPDHGMPKAPLLGCKSTTRHVVGGLLTERMILRPGNLTGKVCDDLSSAPRASPLKARSGDLGSSPSRAAKWRLDSASLTED